MPQSLRSTILCGLSCLSGMMACAQAGQDEAQTYSGELVAYAVDYRDGSTQTVHSLRLQDRSELRLELPDRIAIPSGTKMRLQGKLSGNRLVVSGMETLASPNQEVQAATLPGEDVQVASSALMGPPVRRVALLKLYYGTLPTWSDDDFNQILTTGAQSAKAFFSESSFGKTTVTADQFGWFEIRPQTCETMNPYMDGDAAAYNAGIDLSGYDHVIYWVPSACSPSAMAEIGYPVMPRRTILMMGNMNGGTVAHEMGHNIGMRHSRSWQCGTQSIAASSDCAIDNEYGDTFDVMGNAYAQFQGYDKASQEWFDNCNMVTARRSGVFTLRPIEVPTTGTQVVRIPADPSVCPAGLSPCFYYVEYRQQIGTVESSEYNNTSAMYRGAPIRLAGELPPGGLGDLFPTYLIDTNPRRPDQTTPDFSDAPLLPGKMLNDPTGVAINLIAITRAGMRVQVSLPTDGGMPTCIDGTSAAVMDTTCENRVRDTGETDIDCGGQCGRCVDGRTCSVNTDCWSDTCTNGLCVPAGTCTPESDAAFCSRVGKNCGAVTGTDNCGATRSVASCGSCTAPQICGGTGTANVCGQAPTSPCASLCQNATAFAGPSYQSGNLGTGASCRETTANLSGANCGNFASGRTLRVNGTTVSCTGGNIALPAKRNGGYCFQASSGNYAWAYLSTW